MQQYTVQYVKRAYGFGRVQTYTYDVAEWDNKKVAWIDENGTVLSSEALEKARQEWEKQGLVIVKKQDGQLAQGKKKKQKVKS